jgi:hypothetical protein
MRGKQQQPSVFFLLLKSYKIEVHDGAATMDRWPGEQEEELQLPAANLFLNFPDKVQLLRHCLITLILLSGNTLIYGRGKPFLYVYLMGWFSYLVLMVLSHNQKPTAIQYSVPRIVL